MERLPLPPPQRSVTVRRAIPPAVAPRHPLAGIAAPPVEQWPDKVYGYHPLLPDAVPVCIQRDTPGYSEASSEINPYARNREMGIDQDLAEAIIRAAWAPGGHVWKK